MSIANPHFNGENPKGQQDAKLKRIASIASISVATILITTKLIAYITTNSVSIMSSLMDSTFDALASAVTLFSIIHAATPADAQHRFGHGKLEALAAISQALFIFGSAGYLLFESIHRLIHPEPVVTPHIGISVMLLSIVLTIFLVLFQRSVIKKTGSVAINADHLHYKGDLLMNLSVIIALTLNYISPWPYFDPLFAGGIAFFLIYNAREIFEESYGILMDKELPCIDRAKIKNQVLKHADVHNIHDLRTRHSGNQMFIEFHLEMDGNITLNKAHDITEEIELTLYKDFPKAEILIHQEPAGLKDHRLDHTISNDPCCDDPACNDPDCH